MKIVVVFIQFIGKKYINNIMAEIINTTKELHELFIGCCDMTEKILQETSTKQVIQMTYTESEEGKQCMKIRNMNDCINNCRISSKGKLCLPDYTKLSSNNNNFTITPEIQTLSFKFNSKYDGSLIELIKIIPFKTVEKENSYDSYITNFKYICIYKYNNIGCICFSSGEVLDPSLFLYKKDSQYFRFDKLIGELLSDDLDKFDKIIICGHSMGSAFSQYLCGIDWGVYNNVKTKCYLIVTAGYKCLTTSQLQSINENFNGRIWCYGYGLNMMTNNIYLLDKFLFDKFNDTPLVSLDFKCIRQKATDPISTTILELSTINPNDPITVKTSPSETQSHIFTINDIEYTYDIPRYLIQYLHSWTDSYRAGLIDLLNSQIFQSGGKNRKNRKSRKSIKSIKKNKPNKTKRIKL
jgi:hypothetical protein